MGIYTAKYNCPKLSPLVRELTWVELQLIKLATLSRELKPWQNKTLNTVEINCFNAIYSLKMNVMKNKRNVLAALKGLLG
jgi:hypothetical protein